MESSIAVFLMRQSACELLPTISLLQQRNVERERQHSGTREDSQSPTRRQRVLRLVQEMTIFFYTSRFVRVILVGDPYYSS